MGSVSSLPSAKSQPVPSPAYRVSSSAQTLWRYRAHMAHDHSPSASLPLIVVTLCLGAVTALTFSWGAGAEADGARAETFSGVCDMTGVIRHEPSLTTEPAPTQVRGKFTGTCSGELTTRKGHTRQ